MEDITNKPKFAIDIRAKDNTLVAKFDRYVRDLRDLRPKLLGNREDLDLSPGPEWWTWPGLGLKFPSYC